MAERRTIGQILMSFGRITERDAFKQYLETKPEEDFV